MELLIESESSATATLRSSADSAQDSQIVSLDMVSTQNSTSASYAEQQLLAVAASDFAS